MPHLKRLPSEYIRDNIWVTTQPIEEPERPEDLLSTCEWIGWDRIMFSTDYPHWDQDDPRYAFKAPLPEQAQAHDVPRQRSVVLRPGAKRMARHVVAPVGEIAPGTCKIVTVAGPRDRHLQCEG